MAVITALRKAPVAGLKEEISDFKRRRIREEACRLFFELGYERTTLDAIAQALDVTKPFIYGYYRNKGDLLYEICSAGIAQSLGEMEQALNSDRGPAERLRQLIDRVLRIIIDYQAYIVVYEREEKNLEVERAREIRRQRSLFDHRLAALLTEGHNAGVFRIQDALMTATTIGGMMTWVSLWYHPGGKWSETEVVAHVMRTIESVVMGRESREPL